MALAIGLLKTLLELARARKSGAIDARAGGSRVRLFVESGAVVFADEGTIGETLGRILVREKVIREDQYNAALEQMAQLHAAGKQTRLGEILLEMNALTKAQLDAALSAQVRQKVVRAIGAGSSTFRFVECHGQLDIAARFATAVEPLVLAALRLAPQDDVEELLDLALTRCPTLRGDGSPGGGALRAETMKRVDAFAFQPDERAFVLALDGSRTSAEILGEPSSISPAVVLSALLLTDCLDLNPGAPSSSRAGRAPAPAAAKKAPLRRLATPVTPQKAIRPILKKKAPSSVRPPAPENKEQARTVTARLRAAQTAKKTIASTPPPPPASEPKVGELALWKPETPTSTGQPPNRLLAEQAFQAGKTHVRANDMAAAAAELKRAAALFPAMEYELWAAWTSMRADKAGEASHVSAVRALAEKALAEDPSLGFAYFVLGHLALRARDAVKARELFAKARALDPATTSDAKDVRLREAKEPKKAAAAEPEAKAEAKPAEEPAPPREAEAEKQEAPAPPSKEPVEAAESAPMPAPPRGAKRALPIAIGVAALLAIGAWMAARGRGPEEAPKPAGSAVVAAPSSTPAPPSASAPPEQPSAAPSDEASAAPAEADATVLELDDDEGDAATDAGAPDGPP